MKNFKLLTIRTVLALALGCTSIQADVTDTDALITLKCDVDLAASESGIVRQVHIKDGHSVTKGDILFSLDDAKISREAKAAAQEAQVAQLKAENDVDARFAEKSRLVAEAELRRAKQAVELFEKSVSESELDQLRLQMERAALSTEQAERDLEADALTAELQASRAEISQVRMDDMKIRAPFDGVVIEVQKQAGEWATVGELVARVIQLDQLRVEGLIDGEKYSDELLGKSAHVTIRLPNGEEKSFHGEVTFVSSMLDPDNGLISVWAEVENSTGQLRPGMRGALTIAE